VKPLTPSTFHILYLFVGHKIIDSIQFKFYYIYLKKSLTSTNQSLFFYHIFVIEDVFGTPSRVIVHHIYLKVSEIFDSIHILSYSFVGQEIIAVHIYPIYLHASESRPKFIFVDTDSLHGNKLSVDSNTSSTDFYFYTFFLL